jgi:hypothetical protein
VPGWTSLGVCVLTGSLLYAQRAEKASGKHAGGKFERLAPRRGLGQYPSNVVK